MRSRCAAAAASPNAATADSGSKIEVMALVEDLRVKFGRMGLVSHKKVGVRDLYKIVKLADNKRDYKGVLLIMNLFYNFGVKLKHRELATRLLACAMRCEQESEAVELIKLYSTWLEQPPDTALMYAVMGHFLDAGQPLVVREVAKAVREDWRIALEPPLYILAIEAMLQLPENPLGEALVLYKDAQLMGVRLPAPVHSRLLNESLLSYEAVASEGSAEAENPDDSSPESPTPADLTLLQTSLSLADGLARDGHLRGGANASTLFSLAWLHWHLAALPEATRTELVGDSICFLNGDWVRIFDAAVDNFGCHWGFSSQLPRGLFAALEASPLPEAGRLVGVARLRFGRFYPDGST